MTSTKTTTLGTPTPTTSLYRAGIIDVSEDDDASSRSMTSSLFALRCDVIAKSGQAGRCAETDDVDKDDDSSRTMSPTTACTA